MSGEQVRAARCAYQRESARLGLPFEKLREVEIRHARPDDVETLCALAERAYGVNVKRIGRRPAPMDDNYAKKVTAELVDVAVQDGKLVGLIVLVPDDTSLQVQNVAVEPEAQGHGVGRALLAHAEDTAARLGLRELRLYTNAVMAENLELYPRLGYHEIARRFDNGFDRVFFSKPTRQ